MSGPLVWITGIQGFIGSHLAKHHMAAGRSVVGFLRAGKAQLSELRGSAAGTATFYDLTPAGLRAAIERHGPPARVFHLAGGATVGQSLENPRHDFVANVETTETLLAALRDIDRHVSVVLASSAAVYGDGHQGPIATAVTPHPSSPYGHHKLAAEELVCAHAIASGHSATICRLFSIYGPGLRKQLVYDVCTRLASLASGLALVLGGSGDEIRDWLHINDAVRALASLNDPPPCQASVVHLARGVPTPIREVAATLVRAWGGHQDVRFSGETRAGDPFSLFSDLSSLPPDFQPRISLEDGLAGVVAWMRHARGVAS